MLFLLSPWQTQAQPPSSAQGPPAAVVEVSAVLEKEVLTTVTLAGTAESWIETTVAAQESGLVKEMLVDEGEPVKKGQVLCEQDTSQLEFRTQAAGAALAETEVAWEQAEKEWARQKKLFAREIVAEKALDDARYQAEGSRHKVARLKAELEGLKDQLEKMRIKAPVSGQVVKRHVLVGEWLGEGEAVVTLVVLDPVRVMVSVPERYVSFLKQGETSQVAFDSLGERTFAGQIAAVIPRADPAVRTFPVRVEIPNPDGMVKAGMFARVSLPVGEAYRAILVPKDGLVLGATGSSVFTVKESRARQVNVNTGPSHGSYIEVTGPLEPGAMVVVRGNERLQSGQSVKVLGQIQYEMN
jgi:RND family efflux transporter MFP subunit